MEWNDDGKHNNRHENVEKRQVYLFFVDDMMMTMIIPLYELNENQDKLIIKK